jgi:hypothetical protein
MPALSSRLDSIGRHSVDEAYVTTSSFSIRTTVISLPRNGDRAYRAGIDPNSGAIPVESRKLQKKMEWLVDTLMMYARSIIYHVVHCQAASMGNHRNWSHRPALHKGASNCCCREWCC